MTLPIHRSHPWSACGASTSQLLRIIGTPLFPAWREIFDGLPSLIEQTRWRDELNRALEENAFRDIETQNLTLYGSALITAVK